MTPLGERRDGGSDNAGFTLGQPLIQTISNFLSWLITLLTLGLQLRASHKERRLFANVLPSNRSEDPWLRCSGFAFCGLSPCNCVCFFVWRACPGTVGPLVFHESLINFNSSFLWNQLEKWLRMVALFPHMKQSTREPLSWSKAEKTTIEPQWYNFLCNYNSALRKTFCSTAV